MKHLRIALLALLVVAGYSNVNAQDENNPWAISLGVNAVDFFPTNHPSIVNGDTGVSTGWFQEFTNSEHYNMIPSLSRLSVGRYLDAGFSFELAGSINRISDIGDMSAPDLTYFGIDGAIKYDLNNLMFKNSSWFDPFASVGGGYTWINSSGTGTVNGGLGTNFWVSESIGLNLQTTYKHAFDDDNVLPHFQHAAGVTVRFGGTDTDGDGVYDKDDACPEVFGLEEFNGCPDSDGDGVIDSEDNCVDVAGLAELNGCPDSDEDGIADGDDACPNEKGSKANNGCPDSDGDGVVDGKDNCPNEAGPAANSGCPWSDKDGDKILDKDDACPEVAGVAEHNGCPPPARMTETHISKLDGLATAVYFNSGKDSFTSETYEILDQIVELIKDFPAENFHVGGHTDSVGSKSLNQGLSDSRADAVKAYLATKVGNSFTSAGYGEDSPIASNSTRKGRAQNRRVEIKLVR